LGKGEEGIVGEGGRLSHLNLAECSAQRSIQLVFNNQDLISILSHRKQSCILFSNIKKMKITEQPTLLQCDRIFIQCRYVTLPI
jgi:hypothetical protein